MRNFVSHIGIAVADLDAGIRSYELLLGKAPTMIEEVPDQKVKVAIFAVAGEAHGGAGGNIELVAATAPDSPIARFIARRGEGLHHICVYVDDIDKKLAELKAAGAKLIDETPRIGAEGNRIAFVHPSSTGGVLIELEERKR